MLDTIFSYRFHFGLQANVFRKVRHVHNFLKTHLLGAGSAGAKKVCFEDLSKGIVLEVRNETCS